MQRLSALAFLLLAACGARASAVRVPDPDGHTSYRIECGNRKQCPLRASEVCPDGYIKTADTDAYGPDGLRVASSERGRTIVVHCVDKK